MTSQIARRQFLKKAGMGALAGASLSAAASGQPNPPPVAEPTEYPRLLIGCAAYSFRKLLDAGKMTNEGFIEQCVKMGVHGADMTAYWFKSTDQAYLASLRKFAFKNGMPFTGTGSGPDLLEADPERRKQIVDEVIKWIDITQALGAPHMRIFGGPLQKGVTVKQGIEWTVESARTVVDYAAPKGITLGIEIHKGITQSADIALEILHRVDNPYFGITLDITHFIGDSDEAKYKQIDTCIPFATQTHIRDRFDNHNPIDLDRVWGMFAKHGYRGYMTLEFEGGADPLAGAAEMVEKMKALSKKYSSV